MKKRFRVKLVLMLLFFYAIGSMVSEPKSLHEHLVIAVFSIVIALVLTGWPTKA